MIEISEIRLFEWNIIEIKGKEIHLSYKMIQNKYENEL